MAVLFFVLAAMASLAPARGHAEAAIAITRVALDSPPLFKGDDDRRRTAAFLVAVAFRESSFRNDITGDNGHARCMFQLWNAPPEVLDDPELCTRIAMARLRQSLKACGTGNALGEYAAGPGGCDSARAKRISADRMYMARKLAKASP